MKCVSVSMSEETISDLKIIKSHTGAGPSGTLRALAAKEAKRIIKENEGKK